MRSFNFVSAFAPMLVVLSTLFSAQTFAFTAALDSSSTAFTVDGSVFGRL